MDREKGKRKEKRKQLASFNTGKRRRMFQVPSFTDDPEEIERLMNRPPKVGTKKRSFKCMTCRSKEHITRDCPCTLDKIPGDTTLEPLYDSVCITCGKIGDPPCCGQGHYAVTKVCGGCRRYGHWYWEMKCPKGHVFNPWTVKLPGVEYEDVPIPAQISPLETGSYVPGYFKIKETKNANQGIKKLKNLGNQLVSGVKKLAL